MSAQTGLLSMVVIKLDVFLAMRVCFLSLFLVDWNHFENCLCFLCALFLRAVLKVTKWSNKFMNNIHSGCRNALVVAIIDIRSRGGNSIY